VDLEELLHKLEEAIESADWDLVIEVSDLMREEHPSMPISQDRQSRVTFGGNKKS